MCFQFYHLWIQDISYKWCWPSSSYHIVILAYTWVNLIITPGTKLENENLWTFESICTPFESLARLWNFLWHLIQNIPTSKIGISGLEEYSRDNIETYFKTIASSVLLDVTEGNIVWKNNIENQLKSVQKSQTEWEDILLML